MKILLVDDHRELRAATRELLEGLGHQVTDLADCPSALALVRDSSLALDAVMTDIELPGMSGTDLLEILQQECPDLALLAYSSSRGDDRLGEMVLAGRVVFLKKPFSADSLREKLQEARDALRNPSPQRARERHSFRPSQPIPIVRPARTGAWKVAAALVIAVAGAIVFQTVFRQQGLPPRLEDDVVRGSSIELVEPIGEMGQVPRMFRWQLIPSADQYLLKVREVDGTVVWEEAFQEPFASMPLAISQQLAPAVVYRWSVQASGQETGVLAVSEEARFLVLPGLVAPAGQGPPDNDSLGDAS